MGKTAHFRSCKERPPCYTFPVPFDLVKALQTTSGKALIPHPSFMDSSTPVSTYSPGQPSKRGMISQRSAGRHSSAYGGEQAIDWVYECVNLYADAAASAEFLLEKTDGTKLVRNKSVGTPPEYEEGPKALYELMDQPNPFMLYDEQISLLVIDVLLVGNAYWYKWRPDGQGRPLAIYRLCPADVKIVPDAYGPMYYEYQPAGAREPLIIMPEEMVHFKRPNPHDQWYGMGVIQGGGRAMDLELSITETLASYYDNRAEPSLIIESARRIPNEIMRKYRAQQRARLSGAKNAGEILFLENGMTASPWSSSAQSAMFEELSQLSQRRIYSKFRAHPSLFGQPGNTQGTDKIVDIRREFDNSTLRPFLKNLSGAISKGLTEAYGVKFSIDHRSVLPADDAVKVAGEMAALPGIKIREVRRMLAQFGVEESTGDEKIDNFVLNLPGPEADGNGNIIDPITGKVTAVADANSADRNLPGEPGRPPNGENTSGFGTTA